MATGGAGRRIAVIVGNGDYQDRRLLALGSPPTDVEGLRAVLADNRIGGFGSIQPLVNCTAREILIAIAKAANDAAYGDTLLIYFSGHGLLDASGKLFLAAKDTDYDLLSATAISAQFIAEELDRCRSMRQIIILDCCHSGAFDRSAKSVQSALKLGLAFQGAQEGRGRYLLTATDETQFAYDGRSFVGRVEPSVFTSRVLDGLRTGDADIDGDGQISLDDLHTYVLGRALRDVTAQTPYKWTYKASGKVFIARNIASRGFDVRSLFSLSDDIQSSIVSVHPDIRLGAVAVLSRLMRDGDALVSESAKLALAHLCGDKSVEVSEAASIAQVHESIVYAVPSVIAVATPPGSEFETKRVQFSPTVSIEMVRVPAGRFLMGSRPEEDGAQENEFPRHAVHLEAYWIAKTPITMQQFALFVNSSNYRPASQTQNGIRKAFNKRNRRYERIGTTWRNPFGFNRDLQVTRDHPVVLVDWYDAIAFCKWASSVSGLIVDLPTEAQWEKAARGPHGRLWPWGNEPPQVSLCNFDERNRQTTPVGNYSPAGDSYYGCIDMAGNAWEWTKSTSRPYPYIDLNSTSSSGGLMVLRGGSWRVKAYRLRCAFRKPWPANECIDGHGFRIIARSI